MKNFWRELTSEYSMLAIVFLLVGILCALTDAVGYNAIINTTASALNVTYASAAPSLMPNLTGLTLRPLPTLMIDNPTACRICTNTVSASTVIPSAGNGKEQCIGANTIAFFDNVPVPRGPANVFARADVASCASGIVDLDIW